MPILHFSKMHGLGNDFVVFDGVSESVVLSPEQVRLVADRRCGIGCDQVLVVEPPTVPDADFRYRIYNADGGEVEQCGNGARCVARFVRQRRLTGKEVIPVETAAGIIRLQLHEDGQVKVDMGSPRFAPQDIPFLADRESESYAIELEDGTVVALAAVSMGNPHAVVRVADVRSAPVPTLGPRLEGHPRFPRRANVGFMEVVDRTHIRLRVYERGVGETLACGTGACAAAVVGRRQGLLAEEVVVDLPGGRLRLRWEGGEAPVWMTGPATHVFDGRIDLAEQPWSAPR